MVACGSHIISSLIRPKRQAAILALTKKKQIRHAARTEQETNPIYEPKVSLSKEAKKNLVHTASSHSSNCSLVQSRGSPSNSGYCIDLARRRRWALLQQNSPGFVIRPGEKMVMAAEMTTKEVNVISSGLPNRLMVLSTIVGAIFVALTIL